MVHYVPTMLAFAWICAVLGAIVAYVVSLAGAMRTVPRLYWREALVAIPLPVLAAALAAWRLSHPLPSSAARTERPWISATLALGLALLSLLLILTSYFDQPGGPQ